MLNFPDQDHVLSCKVALRQRKQSAVVCAVVFIATLIICSNTADMNVGLLMYFICVVAFIFLLALLDQIVTIKHHIKFLSPLSNQDITILAESRVAYDKEKRGEGA